MHFFFLDVVDVVPARNAEGLPLVFYFIVAATILIEAVIMLLIRYNGFGKSILHSFLVNVASVTAGFLLFELAPGLFEPGHLLKFLGLLFITIIIEAPVLYLLNKIKTLHQTAGVCILMNIVTYFLFWIWAQYVA